MNVTIYSTHCPQCNMLERLLTSKNIAFSTVLGKEAIIERGYKTAPILDVDGKVMSFAEAVRWVNSMKAGDEDAR